MVAAKKNLKRDSTKPVYYKSMASTKVTVDTESRKISGYAAIWGNIDDANDMLVKGCCSRSIENRGPDSKTNRKIIFLWMHDIDEPLGRIVKLTEDDKGLYFEAEIDKIPEGDRCLEQLKSGTLNQFSIGYMYVWSACEWDSQEGCLVVKEINLFEISVVSLGCNDETEFLGMKSSQVESEKNKLVRDTEKVLKALPYDTQLQIRQLISKHIALAEVNPGKDPLDNSDSQEEKSIDFKQLLNAFNN